jgi:hypothetical protein
MMNDLPLLVMRNPEACFTQVPPDEIVVLNSVDNNFYCLNESAVDLWLALEEPKTPLALTQTLIEKYADPNEAYEQDVCEWIDDMKKKGLVLYENSNVLANAF